ncbi:dephospho-CoA kinase [Candidatus Profftia tarda]|uniref:Dephospho-CoA kinase n=1 Tax=Candidatus Profftia tarda TaxID=1177216 RepID=A0A8E4EY47_9ENTR|nr:dephospho-CoA kinase [Candidatus Profftia tarda]CAD6508681.1 Dephospho-CoA kinase [Candidatus Profftia tarda]
MTYIVALTGGIGSGKSSVAEKFRLLGVPIIDADIIARKMIAIRTPTLQKISDKFGSKILQNDRSINRISLRNIIFNQPKAKIWLDDLMHPLIYKESQHQLAKVIAPYALWIVPLLIENRLLTQVQRILVIDVDPALQLQRTMRRDGISYNEAKKILLSQATRIQRLSCADDIIDNSSEHTIISSRVFKLHSYYLKRAATSGIIHNIKRY